MRFVRINAADSEHKKYKRNCIAAADVRLDKCTETEKTNKTLNRALDAEYNFTYSEGKLRRRFSFKNTVEFIRKEAQAFYNELNKKTTAAALAAVSALAMALVFNVNFTFAYNAFMGDTELGYVPVTFNELTDDESFWKGCEGCINHDILVAKNRKFCICTAMLYDPKLHEEDKI